MLDHSNEVSHWLNSQENKSLLIRKQEDGDIDQTELQFERVTVGKLREKDPDEFVAAEALLLHGEGIIRSGQREAPLPQSVYEIPLTDEYSVTDMGDAMEVKTERAIYTIQAK